MIPEFKTSCCGSDSYRKGRADYHCVNCDEDVTFELVLFADLID